MNPNRGWGIPISGIVLAISSRTCFVPKCGQFVFAISLRKWPFLETNESPVIFIKFRKIADNIPLFGDAVFSNPNRGWKCPIFVSILPITSLTCFVPTFAQFLFKISYREVSISGTDELPGFPSNCGASWANYRCLERRYSEP